jgi:transposase
LAAVYDGASRSEAAEIGGVTLQIVRDWVVKFNAHCVFRAMVIKVSGPT